MATQNKQNKAALEEVITSLRELLERVLESPLYHRLSVVTGVERDEFVDVFLRPALALSERSLWHEY